MNIQYYMHVFMTSPQLNNLKTLKAQLEKIQQQSNFVSFTKKIHKIDSELVDLGKVIKQPCEYQRNSCPIRIKLLESALSSVVFVCLNLKEMYNYNETHMTIDHLAEQEVDLVFQQISYSQFPHMTTQGTWVPYRGAVWYGRFGLGGQVDDISIGICRNFTLNWPPKQANTHRKPCCTFQQIRHFSELLVMQHRGDTLRGLAELAEKYIVLQLSIVFFHR